TRVRFEFTLNLQPSRSSRCRSNPAIYPEAAAGLDGALQRGFEMTCITAMQIALHQFSPAHRAGAFGAVEYFVNAIVFPDHDIRLRIPFENAQARRFGSNPEARLTSLHRLFSEFAMSDVEIRTKDPVGPDIRTAAQPSLVAIRHTQPKFVLIGYFLVDKPLLLGVTLP